MAGSAVNLRRAHTTSVSAALVWRNTAKRIPASKQLPASGHGDAYPHGWRPAIPRTAHGPHMCVYAQTVPGVRADTRCNDRYPVPEVRRASISINPENCHENDE